ncbi:hypothetical protein BZA70DRAFT_283986 [Myxozyma melibiosi]|uniref:Transcription factor CBF/NF-Y/archaeal histone domain-containing protein n=1 Tax=Myxozyma melibiosi TaxID=54550 RepID=A0ABR1EZW8_9ASCO
METPESRHAGEPIEIDDDDRAEETLHTPAPATSSTGPFNGTRGSISGGRKKKSSLTSTPSSATGSKSSSRKKDDAGKPRSTPTTTNEEDDGPTGQTTLPLARVKKIIKLDEDVRACSNSASFAVTVATEMFIQYLCEKSLQMSKSDKRKTLHYKDLASAVHKLDELEFLSDVIPRTVPLQKVLKDRRARAEVDGQGYPSHSASSTSGTAKPAGKSQQTLLKIPVLETPTGAEPMSVVLPRQQQQRAPGGPSMVMLDYSQETEEEEDENGTEVEEERSTATGERSDAGMHAPVEEMELDN